MRNWSEQQRAARALYAVAPRFAAAGLSVAPIKGLALGRWLYPDLAERGMRDLDLLVSWREFARACAVVRHAGWEVLYESEPQRELLFLVEGFAVEVHGEIGRRDLTGFQTPEVLARATRDDKSFDCPVLRVDDVDHFVLLAANVIKDRFWQANPHQARDLALFWLRLAPRADELVRRVCAAGFATGMRAVARWMAEQHGEASFSSLARQLQPHARRQQTLVLDLLRRRPMPLAIGLPAICWTNDLLAVRARCLRRLAQRALRIAE